MMYNQMKPDYAAPPGWILEEYLEVYGISQAELARRCDRSPKLISEIMAGKAPVEPETALQFEKVLGLDASIWLNVEAAFRLHLARKAEARQAAGAIAWARGFPVQELLKRNCLETPESDTDLVSGLLAFFGVATVHAWEVKYKTANIVFRHSASYTSHEAVLTTWLRLGELEAVAADCPEFDAARFRKVLRQIRELTCLPFDVALSEAQALCCTSGVILVCVKPFAGTALSGASRWISPRRALIQLSGRHKTDDHLWFTLFHEAAHLLVHTRKSIFVDSNTHTDADIEVEADKWAANFLIPSHHWRHFTEESRFSQSEILAFARQQEIAPSIVVGRLQHEKLVSWQSRLNNLKVQLDWHKAAV